jgi:tetraacyldisaccharide 4'-kinase
MFLVDAWYRKASWLHLLRPLAALFVVVARWRRNQQRSLQHKPAVPVAVVGNITIGGTGKTPVVLALAEALHKQSLRVGVLSRGYGGRAPAYPFFVRADSDVRFTGDEARLLHRYLHGLLVLDPDRNRGLRALVESGQCDVIISDDGLQHYRLWRDIEIVMVDGNRGLGNGFCLPAGPLREPPARLSEVDYLVINGESRNLDLRELATGTPPVSHCRLAPEVWVNLKSGARLAIRELPAPTANEPMYAVAGIGHPQRFFDTLVELGYHAECRAFADHHAYTPGELAYASGRLLVMTEKDAVKCESFAGENWWYLAVSAQLDERFLAEFCDQVSSLRAERLRDRTDT